MPTQSKRLVNLEKAAVLLIALGPDKAAEVMGHLEPAEIEALSQQILKLQYVEAQTRDAVVAEFAAIARADAFPTQGGAPYAKQVLEKALGEQKASKVLDRIHSPHKGEGNPLDALKNADPAELLRIIRDEHPQTIALILTHLSPEKAAVVLSGLEQQIQAQAAARIVSSEPASPEAAGQLAQVLQSRFAAAGPTQLGGAHLLVDILNNADRSTERNVLEALAQASPDIAEQVRKMMFVFEDIVNLEPRTAQKAIREVDNETLRNALKGATDEVKEFIFTNMSERAAATLKEDLEAAGPVRVRDVEVAQQKIAALVRRMAAAGEAIISTEEHEGVIA
jgi:flagellar motor switch protein FliG